MMLLTAAIERKQQAAELRAQAIDLLRRAESLEQVANGQRDDCADSLFGEHASTQRPLANLASSITRARQQRDCYFPQDIFGEPGWDILLDLYTLDTDGRGVSVTNASLAGNTPPTTGLRWLKLLEDKGLVTRSQSQRDRRVTWVRLTDQAQLRMRDYLLSGSAL